jgi:hypothetical protein
MDVPGFTVRSKIPDDLWFVEVGLVVVLRQLHLYYIPQIVLVRLR